MSQDIQHVIYKYQLNYGENPITLDITAMPLHVSYQNGNIFMWCQVPVESTSPCEYKFYVVATGESFPEHLYYIGTVHSTLGLVFHVLYDM